MNSPQDPIQFLTLDEAHAIDGAMLSTMDKFMTRITISSMRIINQISAELNIHSQEILPFQIVNWIESDSHIRKTQGEDAAFLKWTSPHPDLDFEDTREDVVTRANLSSHEKFLTRMVISSLSQLVAIGNEYGVHIEDLTVAQIIVWMEHEAKNKKYEG